MADMSTRPRTPIVSANHRVGRRVALRTVVGAAALSANGALLAACGGSATAVPTAVVSPTIRAMPTTAPAVSSASGTTISAPTAVATTVPTGATAPTTANSATANSTMPSSTTAGTDGKIASPAEGVPDAFTKPPTLVKSYNGVPGRGGAVTAFTIAYQSPPPAREQNQYWQALEKRLGVKWDPIITPQPEYGAKSAALIAGGDIPDLFYLNPDQNATPEYRAMEQGAFLDLTPYVTGDELKQYKNLATFPKYMWDNVKFKGKLYGVPKPLQRNGNIPFYRGDWTKKLGIAAPKSPDDVKNMLVAFTKMDPDGDGQADTFGMGRYGTDWNTWDNYLRNMFGVPFNWRKNPDGTFAYYIETDEYKQALDWQRQLFAAGGYHPDSAAMNFAQAQGFFQAGKVGMHTEGFLSLVDPNNGVYLRVKQANPNGEVVGLLPPAASGRTPVTYNTRGSFGFTGIPAKVQDKERVRELLRILDYLASPFGTEEYNFLVNGLEGVHHEVRPDGSRVINDRGRSEKGDLVYLMGGLPAIYFPQTPGLAEQVQKQAADIIKIGVDDPAWVLYSPTWVLKQAELNAFGQDRASAIVTGREPATALDQAIKDWRSRGGDMARKEFEQAAKGQ